MASDNINVRVTGELKKHLAQQTGPSGLYDNASEYVRSLIRRDLKNQCETWDWLARKLEPALRADDSSYVAVTADDVISRNKARETDQ